MRSEAPRPVWPDGLERWLPADAARELYRPALADLRVEALRRTPPRESRSRRGVRAVGFTLSVWLLWLECLRLAVFDHLRRLFTARPDRPPSPPRKEYVAMLTQDMRRAFRLFRLEPGFAAAAAVTLALGIGANTALFAVVETVLLRPLPVPGAEELVILKHRDRATGISKEFIAIGDYVDLAARQRSLDLAAYGGFQTTLTGDHEPVRLHGVQVSPSFFQTMRLQPALGRVIGPDDARADAPPVVMLGYELWQSRFGGDPSVLSTSLQLGNTRRLIVGVAPRGFHFPPDSPTDVILPLTLPPSAPAARKAGWVFAVGRLRSGQTLESARAELEALSVRLEQEFPGQNQGSLYYVDSLRDAVVGDTKGPLLLLLAAVGFVLLIACANVGNLLLARSLARQHEMAVREALGAGRVRLAGEILIEALVLALAGGTLGVGLAWLAAPALAALVPDSTRVPGLDAVGLSLPVLGFSLVVAVGSALIFGGVAVLSLWTTTRGGLAPGRRSTASPPTRRAAAALVVGEIAMAGVLVFGAGLTLTSFANLLSVDPGFRTANVLTVRLSVPSARYETSAARADFFTRALAAIESRPEVERAGVAAVTPLTGNNWTVPFERADRPVADGERPPDVGWQAASGGYFEALDIPLRAGRFFDWRDVEPRPPVVIISESIARRFFPGEDPIGHRIRLGDGDGEIVGVVGDIRRASLRDELRADLYFPFERAPQPSVGLFVHTTGEPLQALAAIRPALRALEPGVMLDEVRSMADIAAQSAAVTRLAMRVLTGFAILALALAAIGIYGVLAYSVRGRMRELGTRLALGASQADIVRLVMRQGGVITLAGLAVGAVTGLAAARSLAAVLYGVPSWHPGILAAAAALLGTMAMAACYLPARRAARVDPVRTLAE